MRSFSPTVGLLLVACVTLPEPDNSDLSLLVFDLKIAEGGPRNRVDLLIALDDASSREEGRAEWLAAVVEELIPHCQDIDLQIAILRGDDGGLAGEGVVTYDGHRPATDPVAEVERRARFDGQGSGVRQPLVALQTAMTWYPALVREDSSIFLLTIGRGDAGWTDDPAVAARNLLAPRANNPYQFVAVLVADDPTPEEQQLAATIREADGSAVLLPLASYPAVVAEEFSTTCVWALTSQSIPALHAADGDLLADGEHARCLFREWREDDTGCGIGRVDRGRTEGGETLCHFCQQGDGTPPFEVDELGEDTTGCRDQPPGWRYRVGLYEGDTMPWLEVLLPIRDATIQVECIVQSREPRSS